METTTRMGSRSSSRHGPAVQFSGRVRKWQKTWIKSGTSDKLQVFKWLPVSGDREEEPEELPTRQYRYLPLDIIESQAKADQKGPQGELLTASEANVQSKDIEVVMVDAAEERDAGAETPPVLPPDQGAAVLGESILPQAQGDGERQGTGTEGQGKDKELSAGRDDRGGQVQAVLREEATGLPGGKETVGLIGTDSADPGEPVTEMQHDAAKKGAIGNSEGGTDADQKDQAAAVDTEEQTGRKLDEAEGEDVRSQEQVREELVGPPEYEQEEHADKRQTEEGEKDVSVESNEQTREEARPGADNIDEPGEPRSKPAEGDGESTQA